MHPAERFVSEADGGLVVVVVQYRLGMFGVYFQIILCRNHQLKTGKGFLSGAEVKEKGALNAGLCEFNYARFLIYTSG